MRHERHHMFWTKAEWNSRPISKQVRGMATYIIDVAYINHRLIHASLSPPPVPDIEILRQLRDNAINGLEYSVANIDHPIARHIGRQLLIASLDEDTAYEMLDTGDFSQFRDVE